jgi:hypothetical protein
MKNNGNSDLKALSDRLLWLEATLVWFRARETALRGLVTSLWQTAKPGEDPRPILKAKETEAIDRILRSFSDSDPTYASKLKRMVNALQKQNQSKHENGGI